MAIGICHKPLHNICKTIMATTYAIITNLQLSCVPKKFIRQTNTNIPRSLFVMNNSFFHTLGNVSWTGKSLCLLRKSSYRGIRLVIRVCRILLLELLSVFKNVVKDFRNVCLTSIVVVCRIVSSYVYCPLASLENLFSVLVQDFNCDMSDLGWLQVLLCWKYCAGGWSPIFLDSAFQTSAGFSYVSRTAVFSGTDPLVHHILVWLCWEFVVLGVHW